MTYETVREPCLNVKELAVQTIYIPVARHDAMDHAVTCSKADLHSVRAVRIGRNRLIKLPRPSFVTINAIQQRPCRTNLDAVTALRAIQPAAVGADNGIDTPVARLYRVLSHPLAANACAALAQNASLRIVSHDRREIFFRLSVFLLREALLDVAPIEDHFLQLTFAAAVANRTVKRMISKQKFAHCSLRL